MIMTGDAIKEAAQHMPGYSLLRRARRQLRMRECSDECETRHYLEWYLREELGGMVSSGPFEGMRYVDYATGGAYAPKLLGTYEMELHPWVRQLLEVPYEMMVNVGCAEGYYAVGFALSAARRDMGILAFDIDPAARESIRELAERNGVRDRVEVRGACDWRQIQAWPRKRTLLLCDIEGMERELLDPAAAPALRELDLLVEIHDPPGERSIEDLLIQRFGGSHRAGVAEHRRRRAKDFPLPWLLWREPWQLAAMDEERRLGTRWLLLRRLGAAADA
jgi:hypothetical protein